MNHLSVVTSYLYVSGSCYFRGVTKRASAVSDSVYLCYGSSLLCHNLLKHS